MDLFGHSAKNQEHSELETTDVEDFETQETEINHDQTALND